VVRLDSDGAGGFGGITINVPESAGLALAQLPLAALAAVPAPGWLYWDVQVRAPSGKVWTVAKGTAYVEQGTTDASA
jgi:hypothetical protein